MQSFKILNFSNKKILEANQPCLAGRQAQGRAIEVFSRFHFGRGAKTEILYFASPGTAKKGSFDLSKGEVNRKSRGTTIREFVD